MDTHNAADLARRALAAFNRRDADAIRGLIHPEGRFSPMTAGVDAPFVGPEGVVEWLERIGGVFDEVEGHLDDVEDAGEVCLTFGRTHWRAAGTNLPLDNHWVGVLRTRDDRILSWSFHPDRERALAATPG